MPTYEYKCSRCQYQFERVHGVGETVDRCERCGGPVRRVFSPPALIFKGPGFHVTDYRKTAPPSDGDGKAPGSGKDATGKGATEAKTEAKSTTKTAGSGGGDNVASSAGDGKKAS